MPSIRCNISSLSSWRNIIQLLQKWIYWKKGYSSSDANWIKWEIIAPGLASKEGKKKHGVYTCISIENGLWWGNCWRRFFLVLVVFNNYVKWKNLFTHKVVSVLNAKWIIGSEREWMKIENYETKINFHQKGNSFDVCFERQWV